MNICFNIIKQAEPPRSTNSRTGTATTTPSSSSNRGRPSVEYSEQSYHDCDATLNQSDVFTDPVSSLTIGEETTLMETTKTLDKVKRTDMNRLANPELPHRFTNSLPIETEFPDKPRTLTWSQVRREINLLFVQIFIQEPNNGGRSASSRRL